MRERPNVIKFYAYWVDFLKKNGKEETTKVLGNGHTNQLSRKDRMALLVKLGLREAK